MTLGAIAQAYARRGFAVFPVSPAKVPLTCHGHKDATTDAHQIAAWWRAHPEANIGARCDWFFAVDVDPRSGGHHVLEGWRRVRGEFPRTWRARTGSGGEHVFFAHDAALDAVPLGKLYTGVDIKGGGRGYVLLAPSRNRSGAYRWLASPKTTELARAPRWLIDEIVAVKRPRECQAVEIDFSQFHGVDRVTRARRYARKIEPAISGAGGHNATLAAAVAIARGFALSEHEAFVVLAAEFNPRCQPPWSERDLRRKVREALRVGRMPIGAKLERGAA